MLCAAYFDEPNRCKNLIAKSCSKMDLLTNFALLPFLQNLRIVCNRDYDTLYFLAVPIRKFHHNNRH